MVYKLDRTPSYNRRGWFALFHVSGTLKPFFARFIQLRNTLKRGRNVVIKRVTPRKHTLLLLVAIPLFSTHIRP